MVFIPIYSDQFRNALRCVDAGIAEALRFSDVTVPNLHEKLKTVLNNDKYRTRIEDVSAQFRDNLVDPMEETMYWIEYVARHGKKFPIFKPNAPNIPWYIYLHLDILAAITIALYLTFVLTKYSAKKLLFTSNSMELNKQKQQ